MVVLEVAGLYTVPDLFQACLHAGQTLLLAPRPRQLAGRSHRARLGHLQPGLHLQAECDLLGLTLSHFFI